jgi:hypothetical protein
LIGCYALNFIDTEKFMSIQGLLIAVGFIHTSDAHTPD